MRIIFLTILLVLVGCNTTKTVTSGHDCSDIYIDSIFIEGEHICFIDEYKCSYEENEWVMIVEQ